MFSLGFLEGQGGGGRILTARSLEDLIGKVIKISELKCVCLTYLYKGLARRNSYSSVSLGPPKHQLLFRNLESFSVFDSTTCLTFWGLWLCFLHSLHIIPLLLPLTSLLV